MARMSDVPVQAQMIERGKSYLMWKRFTYPVYLEQKSGSALHHRSHGTKVQAGSTPEKQPRKHVGVESSLLISLQHGPSAQPTSFVLHLRRSLLRLRNEMNDGSPRIN
jgi:hypothetical protein